MRFPVHQEIYTISIMSQLHVKNNFKRCLQHCTLFGFRFTLDPDRVNSLSIHSYVLIY